MLCLLLAGAALLPQVVLAFNVGPYKMGMSAAEARKIGIGVCSSDTRNRIVCDVAREATALSGAREAKIWFDSSRRLSEISVVIDASNVAAIEPMLKMAPCPPKWAHGQWCYALPDLVRKVGYDQPSKMIFRSRPVEPLRIHVEHDRQHVKSFLAARKREARENREVAAIQGRQ